METVHAHIQQINGNAPIPSIEMYKVMELGQKYQHLIRLKSLDNLLQTLGGALQKSRWDFGAFYPVLWLVFSNHNTRHNTHHNTHHRTHVRGSCRAFSKRLQQVADSMRGYIE